MGAEAVSVATIYARKSTEQNVSDDPKSATEQVKHNGSMLGTRWDAKTWPAIKAELKKALEMRSRIQRAGWFN